MESEEKIKYLKEKEFERREKRVKNATEQKLIYSKKDKKNLHITYVMTWTGICGGSKIILEHANKLIEKGHKLTIISHDKKPVWFEMNSKIEFIEVPWEEILGEKIPECDLIVTTYWREIYECIEQEKAPVIYFEQGDYHLFDLEKLSKRNYEYIRNQFKTVKFMYTVSNFAKEKIKTIYNKDSIVIPNAVDKNVFFECNEIKNNNKINIAIIGSENSEFKKIKNILKALENIVKKGYQIKINWITPTEPIESKVEAIVNPPQFVIGDVLRKSDIFICASMYESFCLPVLEAMTCGAAVITTDNGGNMDFVQNNKNALIIEKDNIQDIEEKTIRLIEDINLRNKIAKNGLETSKGFSWERTIQEIEDYYREVANYEVIKGG